VAGDTNGQSDIFRVANPFITSFNATGAKYGHLRVESLPAMLPALQIPMAQKR
jgi:hypothetical protein